MVVARSSSMRLARDAIVSMAVVTEVDMVIEAVGAADAAATVADMATADTKSRM